MHQATHRLYPKKEILWDIKHFEDTNFFSFFSFFPLGEISQFHPEPSWLQILLFCTSSVWNSLQSRMTWAEGQQKFTVVILEAHWMSWIYSWFFSPSTDSMQEFQDWFLHAKAAAKESSDRTGDSKVLEARLQDLQVSSLLPVLCSSFWAPEIFRSSLHFFLVNSLFLPGRIKRWCEKAVLKITRSQGLLASLSSVLLSLLTVLWIWFNSETHFNVYSSNNINNWVSLLSLVEFLKAGWNTTCAF